MYQIMVLNKQQQKYIYIYKIKNKNNKGPNGLRYEHGDKTTRNSQIMHIKRGMV